MTDGHLSLKDGENDSSIICRTNTTVRLPIDGRTSFSAELNGRATLAMYLNLDLPKGGTVARQDMARGGIRCWFQQVYGNVVDVTGLDGPWSLPAYGPQNQLVAHSWPHTVRTDRPWEFCFRVYAYSDVGTPTSHSFVLKTREIKIINDRA